MRTPARIPGAALAALSACLLSGCGISGLWNDVRPLPPVMTPAAPTATLDYRSEHPYTGELGFGSKCVTASKSLLADLQYVGNVGGAIVYTQAVAVRSNGEWWTAAVRTAVDPDGSYDPDSVDDYLYFATNEPSNRSQEWGSQDISWPVNGGSESARKALACLKKLPPAKDPFAKPPSPDETYTGKLAPRATCKEVSAKLLAKLQQVGQVGGAVTYPRGQMVRANKLWWTVAVATKVNPNGDGYTSDNVPPTALFVTDAPSLKASARAGASYFPIKGYKDRAAAKALACLNA